MKVINKSFLEWKRRARFKANDVSFVFKTVVRLKLCCIFVKNSRLNPKLLRHIFGSQHIQYLLCCLWRDELRLNVVKLDVERTLWIFVQIEITKVWEHIREFICHFTICNLFIHLDPYDHAVIFLGIFVLTFWIKDVVLLGILTKHYFVMVLCWESVAQVDLRRRLFLSNCCCFLFFFLTLGCRALSSFTLFLFLFWRSSTNLSSSCTAFISSCIFLCCNAFICFLKFHDLSESEPCHISIISSFMVVRQ